MKTKFYNSELGAVIVDSIMIYVDDEYGNWANFKFDRSANVKWSYVCILENCSEIMPANAESIATRYFNQIKNAWNNT